VTKKVVGVFVRFVRRLTRSIALIDEHMPVVVVLEQGHYDKIVSIQEIKSRSGRIIAVVTKGDTQVRELADFVIEIPETSDALSPLITIPLQLYRII
jgi:glucosamine--fructose-6-phosphate aminotransferase (isomerizing)